MGLSLTLATKQSLNLSPIMLQRLELMALPLTELQERIKDAVESNPALEIPTSKDNSWDNITDAIPTKRRDDDYSDASEYGSDQSGVYANDADDAKHQFMENALSEKETLMTHLTNRLHLDNLSEEEQVIGELLISNLDKDGFNRICLDAILPEENNAILTDTNLSHKEKMELVFKMQSIIQQYEPVGCCCDNWRSSIMVQAKFHKLEPEYHEAFQKMVEEELEKVRANKLKLVCKDLDIDEDTLDYFLSFLKTLTPYPGSLYDSGLEEYIIPDLSIHIVDGQIDFHTSSSSLPDLTISKEFVDLAKEVDDKATKMYIREQTKAAKELIDQIDMRNKNLFKLGTILIEKQSEFFFKGFKYIKPLTQKEVAEEMSVHETTVSRLANSKYIETDWGIISVKQLFSSAIESKDGSTSKTAIKEMIKEILDNHEGPKSLSDQKIANALNEKGISIARRTVTKYRKELNIDSTYVRGN
jgi:RNA polymerase sigma-54 factor